MRLKSGFYINVIMKLYLQEGLEHEIPKILEALVEINENEKRYKELNDALDEEFPGCPFDISCIDDIKQLDEVFSFERVIFIYDDRASEHNWYYEDMSYEERREYNHFLKIERMDDKPITMRQVLKAMSDEPHYSREVVMYDPHRFLESFELSKHSNIQYSMFWGS
jgi:hypothetical protein